MSSSTGFEQPSLDNFFKRKNPPQSPGAAADEDGIIDLTESPPPKKARLPSGTAQAKKSMSNPSSSYFKKPLLPPKTTSAQSHSPLPPISKPSQALSNYGLPRSSNAPPSQSGSAFDTFSVFSQASVVPDSQPDPPASQVIRRTEEQERRREMWQTRIASMGGALRRRRSLALDEAAAAEARKAGMDMPGSDDEGTPIEVQDDMYPEEEDKTKKANARLSRYSAKEPVAAKGKGKGKGKAAAVGPSGQTYTPLEKQYMEIKEKYPDVLLMMEVGYKYKFHGDDAKMAAQELGIVAFPKRNFYSASIPVHRLHIHVKKLISLGYKVGVINQTETAALKKAGDNRNTPFTRELTHLYTASTYVEESSLMSSATDADDSIHSGAAPPPTNALLVVVEDPAGASGDNSDTAIALISVTPGTGEVTWDEFTDSRVRTELETRLAHFRPTEMILPRDLSKPTRKVLEYYSGGSKMKGTTSVRVEHLEETPDYDESFDFLTSFYHQNSKNGAPSAQQTYATANILSGDSPQEVTEVEIGDAVPLAAGINHGSAILKIVDFPRRIVIALAIVIRHMKGFGLENALLYTSSFVKFMNRSHMLLSSNTLSNLEIYRNQTDGGLHGSLLWLLDHCRTRMGKRLLREWIGRPLLDVAALRARADAIEEIIDDNTYLLEKLRSLLVNMPDLVKGLTRVQYGKALPTEVATILVSLVRLGSEFKPNIGNVFRSSLLNSIPNTLPTIVERARELLGALDMKEAKANNKADLWSDPDRYPDIQDVKDASLVLCMSVCESELDGHLREIRKVIKRPDLKYVTVSNIEYLVEVNNKSLKLVPPKWVKISATKLVTRYHTPEVLQLTREREQLKEQLSKVAHQSFLDFQAEVAQCHDFVVVSKQVAVIDCLMSLAQTAVSSGYCKPVFVADTELRIEEGRHPMAESLKEDAYVPFDIDFSKDDGSTKCILGPNMSGKSSTVRAIALIVCMAQMGSFAPAKSVTLGVHDAVHTRMGGKSHASDIRIYPSDEIGRGKSTFMVELSETSDILRTVTPRSLVILDELGRGTSTYDGVAIAYATLSHMAGVGCNTLFVTHYPTVAEQLARSNPAQVSNWYMSFDETTLPDGSKEITFLYNLTSGLANASFGVWCARLAGLPKAVLEKAQLCSDELKIDSERKRRNIVTKRTQQLLLDSYSGDGEHVHILRNAEIVWGSLDLTT
ncbi:hypothetical protein B9479_000139 [Cryptococcus floricola]|uniref:DNA mismatch repair protein MSH3 n=1 Tax=Cryptococcus floricola TaxID=2591691 RepID=A0A5D3BA84_9TREE|nr:hypothetical protein B9479_000139 [Cryptococcus floricola]